MLKQSKRKVRAIKMETITKPAYTRLARRAGVKSISEPTIDLIRQLTYLRASEILDASLIVNDENQTKTLMPNDLYGALHLLGINVTASDELGTSGCSTK